MHDSGKRQAFWTGAVRDTAEGKARPDLCSPFAEERRGTWMALGARKYSERNWEKGMPLSRFLASLCRHVMKLKQGDRSEDHAAAICFNAEAIMHGEEMIRRGLWPKEFDDLPTYEKPADPTDPNAATMHLPLIETTPGTPEAPASPAVVVAKMATMEPVPEIRTQAEACATPATSTPPTPGRAEPMILDAIMGPAADLVEMDFEGVVYASAPVMMEPVVEDGVWRIEIRRRPSVDAAVAPLLAHTRGCATLEEAQGIVARYLRVE